MTRDEILAMEAGPELDALVAEKVMGWQLTSAYQLGPAWARDIPWGELVLKNAVAYYAHEWGPSTDIAPAWKVVEKMHKEYGIDVNGLASGGFVCTIYGVDGHWRTYDETAPLAICRAALLAVMEVEG